MRCKVDKRSPISKNVKFEPFSQYLLTKITRTHCKTAKVKPGHTTFVWNHPQKAPLGQDLLP